MPLHLCHNLKCAIGEKWPTGHCCVSLPAVRACLYLHHGDAIAIICIILYVQVSSTLLPVVVDIHPPMRFEPIRATAGRFRSITRLVHDVEHIVQQTVHEKKYHHAIAMRSLIFQHHHQQQLLRERLDAVWQYGNDNDDKDRLMNKDDNEEEQQVVKHTITQPRLFPKWHFEEAESFSPSPPFCGILHHIQAKKGKCFRHTTNCNKMTKTTMTNMTVKETIMSPIALSTDDGKKTPIRRHHHQHRRHRHHPTSSRTTVMDLSNWGDGSVWQW